MKKNQVFTAGEGDVAVRLDKILVSHFADRTRQYLQKIIEEGCVEVNGKKAKASAKLKLSDKVEVHFPAPKELKLKAVKIPIEIVYEDEDLLVVNKPSGMAVHPGAGESHLEDSLVSALLYYCRGKLSGISGVMRPGIVHRLDKDTSGLLVVAKNDKAHQALSAQFRDREVEKTYYALVAGRLVPERGTIDAPIGRDPRDRKKMAVVSDAKGRQAVTKYRVLKYLGDFTYVEISLITGRTHQIRVHFASIGHPLAGDPLYGRSRINKFFEEEYGLKRVFLHAGRLSLVLPSAKTAQKKEEFRAPLPADLQKVLKAFKA